MIRALYVKQENENQSSIRLEGVSLSKALLFHSLSAYWLFCNSNLLFVAGLVLELS
uniref:Uncharacterized protein n=1 Tax=Rhizophora mucronata TaxID=61149 RepID=A0A2P2J5M5_RHIMU